MTEHTITPPLERVEQWVAETWHEGSTVLVAVSDIHIATQAARWGADQELEACCEWVEREIGHGRQWNAELRAARRPKPPSLKELALHELNDVYNRDKIDDSTYDTLRRALEQLND